MALFIAISAVNSVYCSFWDVVMDWSLGDWSAKYPLLREQLQFDHVWWYYCALVIDPILRFNWLIYIFAKDVQHSTVVSFYVALSEVLRRGIWAVFRIENEQCANNRRLKAYLEPPVPYTTSTEEPEGEPGDGGSETFASPAARTMRRAGTAHTQDYERRRPDVASAVEEDVPESDEEDE